MTALSTTLADLGHIAERLDKEGERYVERVSLRRLLLDVRAAHAMRERIIAIGDERDYFRSRCLALEDERRQFLLNHGVDLGPRPQVKP